MPIQWSAWYQFAVERFTLKQNQDLERRWDYFEYVLRQTQHKSRRGAKTGLSEDTLRTIKEMYKHLEYRVAVAEDSLVMADTEIQRLTLELQNKAYEIGMHQELSGQLSDIKKFAEQHGLAQVAYPPPKAPPSPSSINDPRGGDALTIAELESQLSNAVRQREDLEKELTFFQEELENTKSQMAQVKQEEDTSRSQEGSHKTQQLQEAEERLAASTRQAEEAEVVRKQEQQRWSETKAGLEAQVADLEAQVTEQQRKNQSILSKHAGLQAQSENAIQQYQRSQENARVLFDQVQDLRGNLRVMCRIRPQLGAQDHELENLVTSEGAMSDHLQVISMAKRNARKEGEIDEYEMERVFEKNELNEHIFEEVGQLVGSAINGRNVCIFAYGQTGSGKTHTMNYPWNERVMPEGDVDMGIIPRAVELVSRWMNERQGVWSYEVTGKYIEIYAEKVFDLLRDNAKNAPEVPIKFNKENRNGKMQDFFEAESTVVDLTGEGDFEEGMKQMLAKAAGNRRVRATASNAQSSRSHCLLSLRIIGRRVDGRPGKTDGTLNLIDLAGSEKPSTTDKASQKEGIQINKSLTALRKVLDEMSKNQARASFRESILTKLLQNSLGEGCKTLMFVMISPLSKDREETRNTLEFAMSAQKVKLRAVGKGA